MSTAPSVWCLELQPAHVRYSQLSHNPLAVCPHLSPTEIVPLQVPGWCFLLASQMGCFCWAWPWEGIRCCWTDSTPALAASIWDTREQPHRPISSQLPAVLVRRWVESMNDLLLQAEFSAVSTSCSSLNCCSQPGMEMPRQQPSACLWDRSLSLHDFDFPLPPVQHLLLHAAVTKKAESGIALAADFRPNTAHWQMVQSLTELVCVLLCSAALSAVSCFWFGYYQAATETLA